MRTKTATKKEKHLVTDINKNNTQITLGMQFKMSFTGQQLAMKPRF